nr:zinc finger, CCHC-type [Tanacetum cinerariifolium]
IIHKTTAPYTPQQNRVAEKKNRALKELVNSMLSYSGLSEGFWGETMLTACYLLNMVLNKMNKTTPYELWYKKRPNLSYLIKDALFDENRFSSIPRPKNVIPNLVESQSIEEDLRTYDEAMQSRDAALWKEAMDDEIGSIMEMIQGFYLIYLLVANGSSKGR